jgi:transcription initiation factor TFIID TATA-box-binding protein
MDQKFRVENIVASTTIADELDLHEIARLIEDAEYEPEQFPGLVYRISEPKTATLLFKSGKANCTGAKTIEGVEETIKKITEGLTKAGIKVYEKPNIVVQNMVATYDLGRELDLNTIALKLGLENVEYEPEQFPGLVFRIPDLRVVILLFGSGKIVCTGARRTEEIEKAIERVETELKGIGAL